MCVCVCVCEVEKETERGREMVGSTSFLQLQLSGLAVIHKATLHK